MFKLSMGRVSILNYLMNYFVNELEEAVNFI